MKIDDIIRKCIEIPGISIQRSDFSTELLLKEKEGKGSMTIFPSLSWSYYCLYLCKFSDLDSTEFS